MWTVLYVQKYTIYINIQLCDACDLLEYMNLIQNIGRILRGVCLLSIYR